MMMIPITHLRNFHSPFVSSGEGGTPSQEQKS